MCVIVVFSEDGEAFSVTALDGTETLWQESVKKQAVGVWLKQAYDARRLRRQDALLLVVPETAVVRRVITLPVQARPQEQRAMAAHALEAALGERPAALSVQPLAESGRYAVCGCRQKILTQALAPFGRYRYRIRLIGAADDAVAGAGPLTDGYYLLQDLLWTAVVVVANGRVVDGRAESGGNGYALEQALRASREEAGYDDNPAPAQMLSRSAQTGRDGAQLLASAMRSISALGTNAWRQDKPLLALVVLCLLLPGVLLVALSLRPVENEETAPTTESVQAVQRSDYSLLLNQAYAAKDARIILLAQEANEQTLAVNGRCNEALDLAAYMRTLAAQTPNLHPLLLEMARTSTEDQTFYEFTVQISLEGGTS